MNKMKGNIMKSRYSIAIESATEYHGRGRPGRHLRKLGTGLVAITMSAGILAACSSTSATPAASSKPAANLDLITPGTLLAATQTDETPFAFVQNGKVTGFIVDLVNDMAKGLGVKVQYKTLDFAGLLPAIADHQYDIGAIGVLDTPARAQVVHFSEPVYYGSYGGLSLTSEHITKISQLAGKSVGVVEASAEATFVSTSLPTAQAKDFPTETAAVGALLAHEVQGVIIGGPDTHTFLAEHSNLHLIAIVPLPQANALPMVPNNPKLAKAVNTELNKLFNNGTYANLYHHWFPGTPIPSQLISQHPSLK